MGRWMVAAARFLWLAREDYLSDDTEDAMGMACVDLFRVSSGDCVYFLSAILEGNTQRGN
mgnify:CR=1 FL=1